MALSAKRPEPKKPAYEIPEPVTKRVNFDLEEDKHQQLKEYAARHRKSVSDIMRELIDAHILER